ncbi:MAG: hypothetical protein ACJ763_16365 [Bdellovibrionia bacterium]
MRNLILGLLLVSAYSASACEIERAQFIGKVKNHYDVMTSENSSVCYYQIEFKMFNPAYDCPLTPGEISTVEYLDSKCALKSGDQVSGVIAKSGEYTYIE